MGQAKMPVPSLSRILSGGWIRTNDLRVMSGTSSFFTLSYHSVIYNLSAFHAGHYFGQHVERKFGYILATFGDAMQAANSN